MVDAGLRIGIGLDAGEAVRVRGGFRGSALNRASRLCSLAAPGEILASDGIAHLAGHVDEAVYTDRGAARLKGFDEPVRLVEIRGSDEGPGRQHGGSAGIEPIEQPLPIGGYLGSLPEGDLIGRSTEMNRATELIDSAVASTGRTLLIAGEPGVGKTRLSQEITRVARNRGFLIAAGSCYEATESIPYYPFLEVFATLRRAAPPAIAAQIGEEWPYLGRLLLEHRSTGAPNTSDPGVEQQRLFWSATGFIESVSSVWPVAILLDDLQWADGSSLDLMQHLARRTRAGRVLILGNYRDVEVNRTHPLQAALRDLNRQHLLERIQVHRLDKQATNALIAATVGSTATSQDLISLIYERTDGNPFFVEEVAKTVHAGRDDDLDGAGEGVPESVRSLIGQRLSHLSEGSQDVLRKASVLGLTFRFDDLLAMSGCPEQVLEEFLSEATQSGLVREMTTGGIDAYAFNHALTQQAIYNELTLRKRRRLHLAAAAAIEGSPPGTARHRVAEMAHHFLDGDEPAKALRYSLEAGDDAIEMFAHREAHDHFHVALDLARELDDSESELRALDGLGATLVSLGRYEEALSILEEAATMHERRGDMEGLWRCLAHIGRVHTWAGTGKAGIERLRPPVRAIPPGTTSSGVILLLSSLRAFSSSPVITTKCALWPPKPSRSRPPWEMSC